jgi:hypothetical protein
MVDNFAWRRSDMGQHGAAGKQAGGAGGRRAAIGRASPESV